jgi:hypothetical protein
MKFIVEIDLGNEAMDTGEHVAYALGRVVHHFEDLLLPVATLPPDRRSGWIFDLNGNTVGKWEVIDNDNGRSTKA